MEVTSTFSVDKVLPTHKLVEHVSPKMLCLLTDLNKEKNAFLHQLLGFKKPLEVHDLPHAGDEEDGSLA